MLSTSIRHRSASNGCSSGVLPLLWNKLRSKMWAEASGQARATLDTLDRFELLLNMIVPMAILDWVALVAQLPYTHFDAFARYIVHWQHLF